MTDPRMTPTNDAPVTVEQVDRRSAADLLVLIWKAEHGNVSYGWMRDEESATLCGKRDDKWAVQAFARHRLAAFASAPAGGNGYIEAFYELARMLGIGARAASPRETWDREMRPAIQRAIASAPAGDGPPMYPKDHLENIEKAIDYCDRRLADRFGNFIRSTLQQCRHDPSCGTFDNYDCDCSVADPAALAPPRAAAGERDRALRQAAQEAYRVCAETRHVRLGDKARDAILALQSPPAKVEG